jgi:hypothetical protein
MFNCLRILRTLHRARTCALLALVFVVAGLLPAPAVAIPVLTPIKLTLTVTAVGAGETVADAVSNAVTGLQKDYLVLGYTVVSSMCSDVDPVGPLEPVHLCSAEIEASVLRKFVLVRP